MTVPPSSYGWVILFLTTLAQSSVSILANLPPRSPFVQDAYGLSRAELGLLNIALASGSYFTLIISGRLLDRLGERIMLLLGVRIDCGRFRHWLPRDEQLPDHAGMIALMSIGTAISTPAGSKAVMGWFAPNLRGTTMGIRQVGIPVGGMIAGLLLPPVAWLLGWRGALAVGGILAITGSLVCYAFYRDAPRKKNWSTASLVSFRTLLRQRNLWLMSVYGIAMIAAQFTFNLYIVVFSHERLGLSTVAAGALLAFAQGVAIASRIGWGVLSDRAFGGDRRAPMAIISTIAGVGVSAYRFSSRVCPCGSWCSAPPAWAPAHWAGRGSISPPSRRSPASEQPARRSGSASPLPSSASSSRPSSSATSPTHGLPTLLDRPRLLHPPRVAPTHPPAQDFSAGGVEVHERLRPSLSGEGPGRGSSYLNTSWTM